MELQLPSLQVIHGENSTIIENAGDSANGIVLSTFFDEAEPANDEAASFISGYKTYLKEQKQDEIIPAVAALGYDAYLSALKAIENCRLYRWYSNPRCIKGSYH